MVNSDSDSIRRVSGGCLSDSEISYDSSVDLTSNWGIGQFGKSTFCYEAVLPSTMYENAEGQQKQNSIIEESVLVSYESCSAKDVDDRNSYESDEANPLILPNSVQAIGQQEPLMPPCKVHCTELSWVTKTVRALFQDATIRADTHPHSTSSSKHDLLMGRPSMSAQSKSWLDSRPNPHGPCLDDQLYKPNPYCLSYLRQCFRHTNVGVEEPESPGITSLFVENGAQMNAFGAFLRRFDAFSLLVPGWEFVQTIVTGNYGKTSLSREEQKAVALQLIRGFISVLPLSAFCRHEIFIRSSAVPPTLFDEAIEETLAELCGEPLGVFYRQLGRVASSLQGWINHKNFRTLRLDIIQARHLVHTVDSARSLSIFASVGSRTFQSRVEKGTRKPAWEQSFEFPILNSTQEVGIELRACDVHSTMCTIGVARIPLAHIVASIPIPKWYTLLTNRSITLESGPIESAGQPMSSMGGQPNIFGGEIHLRFTMFQRDEIDLHPRAIIRMHDNVSNVLTDAIRGRVSGKKRRFTTDGFDLDLSYITDNVIAMGFPAERFAGVSRNHISTVQMFFRMRHPAPHHRIYNLCAERSYDAEKFGGNVRRFPFKDNNPCPFAMLLSICNDITLFLNEHPQNVVGIHCKAGKGRTGLVIAALLIFSGTCKTADDALSWFAAKRTYDGKGVTIPSQQRYVQYMEQYCEQATRCMRETIPSTAASLHSKVYSTPKLKLIRAAVYSLPTGLLPQSLILNISLTLKGRNLLNHCSGDPIADMPNAAILYNAAREDGNIMPNVIVESDFRVQVSHIGSLISSHTPLFHCWLHSNFVSSSMRVVLNKAQLDHAAKDKKHSIFPPDMTLELEFALVHI